MKIFKNKLIFLLLLATLFSSLFLVSDVLAEQTADIYGLQSVEDSLVLGSQDIKLTIVKIINVILGLLGIVVLGIVLYGGYTYMTSAGNEEKVEQAKKILINGVIGLIIILSAFTIVSFIIKSLSDATRIPKPPPGETNLYCLDPEYKEKYPEKCDICIAYPWRCCEEYFIVKSITPSTNDTNMNNVVIRVLFSKKLHSDYSSSANIEETVQILKVEDEVEVDVSDMFDYSLVANGTMIELRPNNNSGLQCNDGSVCLLDNKYEIKVNPSVKSINNEPLTTDPQNCGEYPLDTNFEVAHETGRGFYFDGVGDFIEVVGEDFDVGSSDFSIMLWAKSIRFIPSSSVINDGAYLYKNNTGFNIGYAHSPNPRNTYFVIDDDSDDSADPSDTIISTSYASDVYDWTLFTLVKSEGVMTVYVNDRIVDSVSGFPGSLDNNSSLLIGRNAVTNKSFNGFIDDVSFYKRALSAEEVVKAQAGGPVDDRSLLVGEWKFESVVDGIAEDTSGSENNATVHGASWMEGNTSGDTFVWNESLVFDGEDDYIEVAHNDVFNFTDELTISTWIKSDNEGYVVAKDPQIFGAVEQLYPERTQALLTNGAYVAGYKFKPLVDGYVNKICGFLPPEVSKDVKMWSFNNNSTLEITSAFIVSGSGASEWVCVDIDNVDVVKDNVYVIGLCPTGVKSNYMYREWFPSGFSYPVNFSGVEIMEPLAKFETSNTCNVSNFVSADFHDNSYGYGLVDIDFVPTLPKVDVPFSLSTIDGGEFLIRKESVDYKTISSFDINDSKWHHVVVTYDKNAVDGMNTKFFVDAQLSGSSDAYKGDLPTNDLPLFIGHHFNPEETTGYFDGKIRDLKIYNKVIPLESFDIFSQESIVDGLVSDWDFSSGVSGSLKDIVSGYDGVLKNGLAFEEILIPANPNAVSALSIKDSVAPDIEYLYINRIAKNTEDITRLRGGKVYDLSVDISDESGFGNLHIEVEKIKDHEGNTVSEQMSAAEYYYGPLTEEGSDATRVDPYNFSYPLSFRNKADTTYRAGIYRLKVTFFDIDNNHITKSTLISLIPESCTNGQLDPGEEFEDVGGVCGGGDGDSCQTDYDCSYSYKCVDEEGTDKDKICRAYPFIEGVSPAMEGAAKNWITIYGKHFGESAGEIEFAVGDHDDSTTGEWVTASLADCDEDVWHDKWVVVEVPENSDLLPLFSSSTIRLETSYTIRENGVDVYPEDTTANEWGRDPGEPGLFYKNEEVYPGLCSIGIINPILDPETGLPVINAGENKGLPGDEVKAVGKNFVVEDAGRNGGKLLFGGDNINSQVSSWSDAEIFSQVPELVTEWYAAYVKLGKDNGFKNSNAVPFKVLDESFLRAPFIEYITPATSTPGSYITIYGKRFGDQVGYRKGRVFLSTSADKALGCLKDDSPEDCVRLSDAGFPIACEETWFDDHVIVRIPENMPTNFLIPGTELGQVDYNLFEEAGLVDTDSVYIVNNNEDLHFVDPNGSYSLDNARLSLEVTLDNLSPMAHSPNYVEDVFEYFEGEDKWRQMRTVLSKSSAEDANYEIFVEENHFADGTKERVLHIDPIFSNPVEIPLDYPELTELTVGAGVDPVVGTGVSCSGVVGDWIDPSSWSDCNGTVPQDGDDVVLGDGSKITIGDYYINKIRNLTLQSGSELVQKNKLSQIISGDLVVKSGGTLTHFLNYLPDASFNIDFNIDFSANNIVIESGGAVNADLKGFARGDLESDGNGPGKGIYSPMIGWGGGAGHASPGGKARKDGILYVGGDSYGTEQAITLGSSGAGSTAKPGGHGGGLVMLSAGSSLSVQGLITSKGGSGLHKSGAIGGAGGSGGSIRLSGADVIINGSLSVDGGSGRSKSYTDYCSGQGSGGYIYIGYEDTLDETNAVYSLLGSKSPQDSNYECGSGDGILTRAQEDAEENIAMIPDWEIKSFESSATSLSIDNSGNLYVVGKKIRKFNSEGEEDLSWNKSFYTEAYGVDTDSSDNVYVVGHSRKKTINDVSYNTTQMHSDWEVVKYSPSGDELWSKTLDGGYWRWNEASGSDVATSVVVDSQDNIYVSGYGGNIYNNQYPGLNGWIRKYDSEGNPFLWESIFSANSKVTIDSSVVDSQDNLIIGGSDAVLYDHTNYYDYFVKKYNSEGAGSWGEIYDPSNTKSERIFSVAVDSNDNVYFAGQTFSSYPLIKKFSSSGHEISFISGSFWDFGKGKAEALAVDSSDNIYIGFSLDDKYSNVSKFDWVIKKYSSSGTELDLGGYPLCDGVLDICSTNGLDLVFDSNLGDDYIYDMEFDNNGNLYVVGKRSGGSWGYGFWLKKFTFACVGGCPPEIITVADREDKKRFKLDMEVNEDEVFYKLEQEQIDGTWAVTNLGPYPVDTSKLESYFPMHVGAGVDESSLFLYGSISDLILNKNIFTQTGSVVGNLNIVLESSADEPLSTSGNDTYTVVEGEAAPSICRLDPNSGPVPLPTDEVLRIFGDNFPPEPYVYFQGSKSDLNNVSVSGNWLQVSPAAGGVEMIDLAGGGQALTTNIPYDIDFNFSEGPHQVRVKKETTPKAVSNPEDYLVVDCTKATEESYKEMVDSDYQCCEDGKEVGKWKLDSSACEGETRDAGYVWRFTTGLMPRPPYVVESCDEDNWGKEGVAITFPSPVPWREWKSGESACVNSTIAVYFNRNMDATTINSSTVKLFRCIGSDDPETGCTEEESLQDEDIVYGSQVLYIRQSPPSDSLEIDTWYQVKLFEDIESYEEVSKFGVTTTIHENLLKTKPCDQTVGEGTAYCYYFKTGSELCRLEDVDITPPSHTTRFLGIVQSPFFPYTKTLEGINNPPHPFYYLLWGKGNQPCSVINIDGMGWQWSTADATMAETVDPPDTKFYTDTRSKVKSLQNTAPETVDIISELTTTTVVVDSSGVETETVEHFEARSPLKIDLYDPEVINWWPNCTAACANGAIGVQFNMPMATDTYAGGIVLELCSGEFCDSIVGSEILVTTTEATVEKFEVAPVDNLSANRWYRVTVSSSIKSIGSINADGSMLEYGDGLTPHKWRFRTKIDDEICVLDTVTLSPDKFQANIIGQKKTYSVVPLSSPDQCSAFGQRLNPWSYGWEWDIKDRVNEIPEPNYSVATTTHFKDAGELNLYCDLSCLPAGSDYRSTQPEPRLCGNGVVEQGEDCDIASTTPRTSIDGSIVSEVAGQSCNLSCLRPGNLNSGEGDSQCGDGVVDYIFGEECDVGDVTQNPYCRDDCLWKGSKSNITDRTQNISECGSGSVTLGEDCDFNSYYDSVGCSGSCLHMGTELAQEWCDEDDPVNQIKIGDTYKLTSELGECRRAVSVCGNSEPEKGEECEFVYDADGIIDNNKIKIFGESGEFVIVTNESVTSTANLCNSKCLLQNICEQDYIQEHPNSFRCAANGNGCNNDCTLGGASLGYYLPSSCGDADLGWGEYPGCELDPSDAMVQKPVQLVTAIGEGVVNPETSSQEAYISAKATSYKDSSGQSMSVDVEGLGEYDLYCGFTEYSSVDNSGNYNDCTADSVLNGVGNDKCCRPRSARTNEYPVDGAGFGADEGVCLNTYIEVKLPGEIDENTLEGNVYIASGHEAGYTCLEEELDISGLVTTTLLAYEPSIQSPTGFWNKLWNNIKNFFASIFADSTYASQFSLNHEVWCGKALDYAVNYEYSDEAEMEETVGGGFVLTPPNEVSTTTVSLYIDSLLEQETDYTVLLRGGYYGIKTKDGIGIRGADNFGAEGDELYKINDSWVFETGTEICSIDRISVFPGGHLFQVPNSTSTFQVLALTDTNQMIVRTPEYNWSWNWGPSNSELFNVPPTGYADNEDLIVIGATNLEGHEFGFAQAEISNDSTGAQPVGSKIENKFNLTSSFCESPWPAVPPSDDWIPFHDEDYNFDFSYCTDAGVPGDIGDDLPFLLPVEITDPDKLGRVQNKSCEFTDEVCEVDSDCPEVVGSYSGMSATDPPGFCMFAGGDLDPSAYSDSAGYVQCDNNLSCRNNSDVVSWANSNIALIEESEIEYEVSLVNLFCAQINFTYTSCLTNSSQQEVLKKYILASDKNDDAIGIQILKNPGRLSAFEWYKEKFKDADDPTEIEFKGYDAIVDANEENYYINALNVNTSTLQVYNNIYQISLSQGMQANTQNVFTQIQSTFNFNTNLEQVGLCTDGSGAIDLDNEQKCDNDFGCYEDVEGLPGGYEICGVGDGKFQVVYGNDIYDNGLLYGISTKGEEIFVGTSRGKILHSEDNGGNWSVFDVGGDIAGMPVNSIVALSGSIVFAAKDVNLAPIRVLNTNDNTWQTIYDLDNSIAKVNDIDFVDDNRGWAVGSKLIWISNDGGINWTKEKVYQIAEDANILFEDTNFEINSLHVFNESDGLALGYTSISGGGEKQVVFKRGINGTVVNTSTINNYDDIDDKENAWVVYSVVDYSKSHNTFHDISFINDDVGFIVGKGSLILKTIDGGETWGERGVSISDLNIKSVKFVDENNGTAVANIDNPARSFILKTSDVGETWSVEQINTDLNFRSDYFDYLNTGDILLTGPLVGSADTYIFKGTSLSSDVLCGIDNCSSPNQCIGEDELIAAQGERVCKADKSKLLRDWTRVNDVRDIQTKIESYKNSNDYAPDLKQAREPEVGSRESQFSSYLPGYVVSRWPSWGSFGANVLGASGIAQDPINFWKYCPTNFEQTTCWNEDTLSYYCTGFSSVYEYEYVSTTDDYTLHIPFEYLTLADYTEEGDILGDILPNTSTIRTNRACVVGQTTSLLGEFCGDGLVNVGSGEACDPEGSFGDVMQSSTPNYYARQVCNSQCQWDLSEWALGEDCGNGIVEGGEACDDGALNGTYGHCADENSVAGHPEYACHRLHPAYCGDGVKQNIEACDTADSGYINKGYCDKDRSTLCSTDSECHVGRFHFVQSFCVESGGATGNFCKGHNTVRCGGDRDCRLLFYKEFVGDNYNYGPCLAENTPFYHINSEYSCAVDCGGSGDYCGDGWLQGDFEQCDDGNKESRDGCSSSCLEEDLSCLEEHPQYVNDVSNGFSNIKSKIYLTHFNESDFDKYIKNGYLLRFDNPGVVIETSSFNTDDDAVLGEYHIQECLEKNIDEIPSTGRQICVSAGLNCDFVKQVIVISAGTDIYIVEKPLDCNEDLSSYVETSTSSNYYYAQCDGRFVPLSEEENLEEDTVESDGTCGNDIKDEGEVCDEGDKNGIECEIGYGWGCSYCAADCKKVLRKDPVVYCGNGEIETDYEEVCDVDNGVPIMIDNDIVVDALCYDIPGKENGFSAGNFSCENNCRSLVNNCIECGAFNISSGSVEQFHEGALPRFNIYSVLTPDEKEDITFNDPSLDRKLKFGYLVPETNIHNSGSYNYALFTQSLDIGNKNPIKLSNTSIETNNICNNYVSPLTSDISSYYWFEDIPSGANGGTIQSTASNTLFKYEVADEKDVITREYVVSPNPAEGEFRVVVKWSNEEAEMNAEFQGIVYNDGFDENEIITHNNAYLGSVVASAEEDLFSSSDSRICNSNDYETDCLGKHYNGVYVHGIGDFTESHVQSFTIDTKKRGLQTQNYAFIVDEFANERRINATTFSSPIYPYLGGNLVVEVYEHKTVQGNVYQPDHVFEIKDLQTSDSDDEYWYVFDLVYDSGTNEYNVRPVEKSYLLWQSVLTEYSNTAEALAPDSSGYSPLNQVEVSSVDLGVTNYRDDMVVMFINYYDDILKLLDGDTTIDKIQAYWVEDDSISTLDPCSPLDDNVTCYNNVSSDSYAREALKVGDAGCLFDKPLASQGGSNGTICPVYQKIFAKLESGKEYRLFIDYYPEIDLDILGLYNNEYYTMLSDLLGISTQIGFYDDSTGFNLTNKTEALSLNGKDQSWVSQNFNDQRSSLWYVLKIGRIGSNIYLDVKNEAIKPSDDTSSLSDLFKLLKQSESL
jgi:cysteine-rich repeat protein